MPGGLVQVPGRAGVIEGALARLGLTTRAERKRLERALADQAQQTRDLEKLLVAVLEEDRGFHLLPPADLRLHVGARDSAANWWGQGRNSARRVIEVFGQAPPGPVLDWGCGSGRTLHWLWAEPAWRGAYRGCDVDAKAIRWLQSKGVDAVTACAEAPPLPYEDGAFAGLFSFSVLTHIPPELHRDWYQELHRVLAPGARAHLTVQGPGSIDDRGRYTAAEAAAYRRRGRLWAERDGWFKGAAVVSEAFTRDALDGLFAVERYTPEGYARLDELIVRKL